ncbi:probable calcium-binding protein CML31 [Protopterus annectens]|uniref:probable calcium-binding protein CML31 n=1 Tax=Protopterus annectens TaxID=7888 RepID=UPI001CFAED1D|nr:probable calcium-binding protein CML31 [Protopterus annectens]
MANQYDTETVRKFFDEIDTDKSGKLTCSELYQVLKKCDPKITQQECDRIIHCLDKDGDGKVSFQEFLVVFQGSKK